MTDRELWDAAWKELALTTDAYPAWKKKGFPASSHWAKAKALGDQIGVAPPARKIGLGAHFHGQWEGTDIDNARRDKILDLMVAAGLSLRMDIEWAYIETAKGVYSAYELAKYDYVFAGAKARGIEVLGIPFRTPAWARPAGTPDSVCPTRVQDYGDFCVWAANRWQLPAIEVWNEEDPNQTFWTGTTAQYVALLKNAYSSVKAVLPTTKVVLGGISCNDDAYVTALYAAGVKGSYDVMALHPYQQKSNLPPSTPDSPPARWNYMHYPAVLNVMAVNGDGTKPVWLTELGWSTHTNTGSEANWDLGVTEQQQADFTIEALRIAGGWPNVERIYVYKIDDESLIRGRGPQLSNYGLVHVDLTPKPSYTALKSWNGH